MTRLVLVLFLAMQFAGVVSIASAGDPWPGCLPCRVALK